MSSESEQGVARITNLANDYFKGRSDEVTTSALMSNAFASLRNTNELRDALKDMCSTTKALSPGGPQFNCIKNDRTTDATTDVWIKPGLYQSLRSDTMTERNIHVDLRAPINMATASFDQQKKYENDKQRFRDGYYAKHGTRPPLDPNDLERQGPR
jgi:hypothetical protein